jgi:histidyl-tRNA synthetase
VARLYIDNLSRQKTARLFYVTNIFIFEETGKETREKWQCGAELIGEGSPVADAELLAIALEVLQKTGLKNIRVKLSHAGIIRALLAGFGLSQEDQGKIFDQILDGDVAVLERLHDQTPELVRLLTPLLDLKGESSGFLKNLRAVFDNTLESFTPALDNFTQIVDLLTGTGQKYEIDIGSGRGFEYYTGVIFQLFAGETKVGGGGRYDALIPQMGGRNMPACGFALYMDPLMDMIKARPSPAGKAVVCVTAGPGAEKIALEAVKRLHTAGYAAGFGAGGPEAATWRLDVIRGAQPFTLTGPDGKKKKTAPSIDAVIELLESRS